MKKHFKALLFYIFVMLTVTVAVVMTSAATDGAAVKEDGHFYSVTDANGENATYYTTLAAAIAAVDDNDTVTVLKNASEAFGQTLAADKTYTIQGADESVTLTFTGCTAGEGHGLCITAGNVTFQSIKIDGDATMQDCIQLAAAGVTVTLKSGVDFTNDHRYGVWLYKKSTLNIEDGVKITSQRNAVRVQSGAAGSVVNIYGGELKATTSGTTAYGTIEVQGTANLSITGGTITRTGTLDSSAAIYIYSRSSDSIKNSVVTVSNATISAPSVSAIIIGNSNAFTNVKTTIKDTQIVTGSTWLRTGTGFGTNCTITLEGVSVTLTDGAPLPSEANTNADHADVALTVEAGISANLTEAAVKSIASKTDMYGVVSELLANTLSEYKSVSGFDDSSWHYLVMNNDDAKVQLSGDALTQHGVAPLITVTKGSLIAITIGSATYTEGTHFYSTKIEGTDYYYASLEDAISEVISGGTITLLSDVSITSPSLDTALTYTIDGAGFTMKITPVAYMPGSNAYDGLIRVTNGNVTIQNLTVSAPEGAAIDMLMLLAGAARSPKSVQVTLDNVKMDLPSEYGIWLYYEATLTIKGENTAIRGGDTNFIRVQSSAGNSVITLEDGHFDLYGNIQLRGEGTDVYVKGGSYTVREQFVYIADKTASGNIVTLSGGDYTISKYFIYINNASAADNEINIEGGFYTTTETAAGHAFVYCYQGDGNTFNISGGTITHNGTGAYVIFRIATQNTTVNFPKNGSAVVNANKAKNIFAFNTGSANASNFVLNLQSGTFDGSVCWVFANRPGTITVNGSAHFKDTNGTLDPASIIEPARYIGGFSLNGANGAITMNVQGGTLETNTASDKPCAIYMEAVTLNISGGTIKGSNNAVRVGNGTSTVNITGGTLENVGSANQLIRVNTSSAVCTVNIREGANLVQNQNQHIIRVQAGVGIINMTGGRVAANGTKAPFLLSTGDASEVNVSGGTVITSTTAILADAGKQVSITGGIFILNNGAIALASKSDDTQAAATTTVSGVIALLAYNAELSLGNGKSVAVGTNSPSIKYGGNSYYLYMETATNAVSDIVTETTFGASIHLGGSRIESGIRFITTLSDSIIALAKTALDADKTVSYGTLIAPADYVAAVGSFTKAALDTLIPPDGRVAYVDVPAINSRRDSNNDGVYESFSASLVNIREQNFSREFAAVAYVVIDGVTYYSAYNTVDNARSIQQIAAALLENNAYAGNTEVLAMLNAYASATDIDSPGFHPSYTPNEIELLDPSREYTVLFIGNSYTICNDLAGTLFPAIATSAGYNMTTVKAIKSSWYLIQSANPDDANGAKVHAALEKYDFDFIVMQEQSTCSINDPGKFYDGARAINDLAIAEGAKPLLYCTWGRKQGHSYLTSKNLTTETMMWKVAAAYAAIGKELGVDVSNVGMAFYDVFANNPSIELYDTDKHHPSYAGSFLAALTLFARMTGVDPTTIAYNGDGTITAEVAAILKEAARKAVFETPIIPDSYKTSSVGVSMPKSIDASEMDNLTTLPSSSIISAPASGITGTKGAVASAESSTTGLTDAQKADIADIGYGISVIGIEKMASGYEDSLSSLIDGIWSVGSDAARFTFDDKKYNIDGDVDDSALYSCLITLNFGKAHIFDAIGFCSGDMNGFAGTAEVFVSDDGITWTRVPTACWDKIYGSAISACSTNPVDAMGGTPGKTCLFNMGGVRGQYVRMGIVIGRNDQTQYHNTISTRELVVYGSETNDDI